MNDPDAWMLSEEADTNSYSRNSGATVSARRIKSLIEQVTGMLFVRPDVYDMD